VWHIWTSVEPEWGIGILRQRLGLQYYRRLSWQAGKVLYPAEDDKILISKEGHD
jgi:hypothetical protein